MSINKLISIHNPIMDAMEHFNLDHDKYLPKFTNLATKAEKEIGSWNQYERMRAVLDITGCTTCLPVDCVLVEIAIMGDLGASCENIFATVCGSNDVAVRVTDSGSPNFLVVDIGDAESFTSPFGYVNHNIQDNKIIFDYDYTGQKVTIQYLRYKTDCNGFVEVSENHVNAIREYIIWQHLRGKKNKNYIDRDDMRDAEREWHRECAHARAEDNRSTFSQRQEIAAMYNDPFSGRGMWQGLYTTLGNSYFIW
jgi:hypothetical protein